MSDLRLAQKTEPTITEQARDSVSRQLIESVYSKYDPAAMAATLASTDKASAVLPKLTVEEKTLRVVGQPSHCPQYFGPIPEVAAFGGALALSRNSYLGSALMVGAGGYQGYMDVQYLAQSKTMLQRTKFTGALLTDASMCGGGILTVAKVGPKWLAPSLMLGGFAGRVLMDLVPDVKQPKGAGK